MVRPFPCRGAGAASIGLLLMLHAAAAGAALLGPQWATGGIANVAVSTDIEVLSGNAVAGTTQVSNAVSSASIEVMLAPVPRLTATANGYDLSVPSGGGAAFAQGLLLYFGRVNTPDGLLMPDSLPVLSSGSLFSMAPTPAMSSAGGSDSRAKLTVNGITVVNAISAQGVNNGVFTVATSVPVTTNQTFIIELFTRAWTFEPGMSAVTVLDPYFSLTPAQIAAGYTLELSPGVGNAPPGTVPLPGAAALLSTAVALIGLVARRRRPSR